MASGTYHLSSTWTAEQWAAFKKRIPGIRDTTDIREQDMRRAVRVDANQGALVSYLRSLGCKFAVTSAVGDGSPDLVIGHSRLALAEVKDPRQPRHDRQKNKAQADFASEWNGHVWRLETTKDCDKLFEWISRSKT